MEHADIELAYGNQHLTLLCDALTSRTAENAGLDDIVYEERALAKKYSLPYADLSVLPRISFKRIHLSLFRLYFVGAVGLSNCDGAPRLRFLVGRSNTSRPAPDGLIPAPFHSVETILARVKDAGFEPEEMVTLLASHSIATQHTIDPTVDVSFKDLLCGLPHGYL